MGQNWDLDFSGETPEQVDLAAGRIPDGWYRAILAASEDDLESGAKKLQFKVSQGLHAGKKITQTLWHPRFAPDEEKAKSAMQKARIFAVRMGLVPREAKGAFTMNFDAALNKEFVVKVKTFKSEKTGKEFAELEYSGVFPFDHRDIPADVRVALGLSPLAGAAPATATTHAAHAAVTTSTPGVTVTPMAGGTPPAGTAPKTAADASAGLWG